MSKASPSKDHPVSPDNSKSKEPKSKTGKSKRISVRLDSDAEAKLNSAIANGYFVVTYYKCVSFGNFDLYQIEVKLSDKHPQHPKDVLF